FRLTVIARARYATSAPALAPAATTHCALLPTSSVALSAPAPGLPRPLRPPRQSPPEFPVRSPRRCSPHAFLRALPPPPRSTVLRLPVSPQPPRRPAALQSRKSLRPPGSVALPAPARGPPSAAPSAAAQLTRLPTPAPPPLQSPPLLPMPTSSRSPPHSGISPCFFAGLSSRLACSASSAIATARRVSAGSITSSTSRRPAATNGFANVSRYSSTSSLRRAA